MFYEVLMEKSAKHSEEKKGKPKLNRDQRRLLAAAGVLGGAKALDASAPLVTGRRTLYHGTSKDTAAKIRQVGLQPALARAADGTVTRRGNNITNLIQGNDLSGKPKSGFAGFDTPAEESAFFDSVDRLRSASDPDDIEKAKKTFPRGRGGSGSVYLDARRGNVRQYANQQAAIARHKLTNNADLANYRQSLMMNPLALLKHQFSLADDADIVKARVPYDLERRMIMNPEVQYHEDVTLKNPFLFEADKRQMRGINKELAQAYVLPGELGPEHIVGSNKFKRHSLGEFKDYAMKNKGRFAKGVGLGTLGALGVGLGGRELYDQFQQRKRDKK